jgi:hypothetical protein
VGFGAVLFCGSASASFFSLLAGASFNIFGSVSLLSLTSPATTGFELTGSALSSPATMGSLATFSNMAIGCVPKKAGFIGIATPVSAHCAMRVGKHNMATCFIMRYLPRTSQA